MQSVREVLDDQGVVPSKTLGQNFLTDTNTARWIVDQLEITPEDTVVEVGPGTGALTQHLIGLGRKTILIEFDARLAQYHKERWKDHADVEVHHADGARWDPRCLFSQAPVKWIGNLPYSCGSAIMQNFLNAPSPVSRAVLMLQKEFVDRVVATPADDSFGALSLRIQAHWNVSVLKVVPPEAFFPRPKIDSSVMLLLPRKPGELPAFNPALFDELTKSVFSQRRKQMKRYLPAEPAWNEVFPKIGCKETARGEELSLMQWIELTNAYSPLKPAQSNDELFDVVDEKDIVIGQASRGEVHEKNLQHRAVHLILVNKRGDILLQLRSSRKDRHPLTWDSSAAGHVDSGETYEQAAQRELAEELGIELDSLREIAHLSASEETGWEHIAIFVARCDGKVDPNYSEIEAVQWFSPDFVENWIKTRPQDFAPAFCKILQKLRS